MKADSVPALCEAIWEAEKTQGLLDLDFDGVKAWQGLRYTLFLDLAVAAGLFEPTATAQVPSRRANLKRRLGLLRGSVSHNPFLAQGPVDAVVFEDPRPIQVDGAPIGIHTHYLVQDLEAQGQRLVLLDRPNPSGHWKAPHAGRRYLDYVLAETELRLLTRPYRPSSMLVQQVGELEQYFQGRLGLRVSWLQRFATFVGRHGVERDIYTRLFHQLSPQKLYIVCAYNGPAGMLAAARDRNITIAELQHGTISRFHLGYSYPVKPREPLAFFPDELYSWGGRWNQLMDMPSDVTRVVDYGFTHFERQTAGCAGLARKPRTLAVLSQTSIGKAMAELVLQHAPSLRDWTITYKLHPHEYGRAEQVGPLATLAELPNVTVVEQTDLYRLLAESDYVLGVYSTTVYEAIVLGARAVLADLPGVEYMQGILEQGHAMGLDDFIRDVAKGD